MLAWLQEPAFAFWLTACLGLLAATAWQALRTWRRAVRAEAAQANLTGRLDTALNELDLARGQLKASDQRWREVLDAVPGAIAVYDNQDRLIAHNHEAGLQVPYCGRNDAAGLTYEELLRRALAAGEAPEAQGREEEWLALRLAGRGHQPGAQARLVDDSPWVHTQVVCTPSGYLAMSRLDIGPLVEKGLALERANEQLLRVSTTDGLTGIANRRQFEMSLQSEWQRSARSRSRISVVLVDIDHFRHYNKVYGHQSGDECLRQLARLLSLSAKRSGELVARYDGDEFALLLPGADASEARRVAERCLEQIHGARIPHAEAALAPWLTASVGFATQVAAPGVSCAVLIDEALQSLAGAKLAGRDRLAAAQAMSVAPVSQAAGL